MWAAPGCPGPGPQSEQPEARGGRAGRAPGWGLQRRWGRRQRGGLGEKLISAAGSRRAQVAHSSHQRPGGNPHQVRDTRDNDPSGPPRARRLCSGYRTGPQSPAAASCTGWAPAGSRVRSLMHLRGPRLPPAKAVGGNGGARGSPRVPEGTRTHPLPQDPRRRAERLATQEPHDNGCTNYSHVRAMARCRLHVSTEMRTPPKNAQRSENSQPRWERHTSAGSARVPALPRVSPRKSPA